MKKVVVSGLPGVSKEVIDLFENNVKMEYKDAEVVYIAEDEIAEDEFIEKSKGAEVVVSWVQQMTEKTYQKLNLRAFCAPSIGFDAANINIATKNNVLVTNCGDYCAEEVAIHTMMLVLNMARKAYACIEDVKHGNWSLAPAENIKRFSESTIGLVGFGNIPKNVAKMLAGFDVNVIAYDPYVSQDIMDMYNVKKVKLNTLITDSDYISLHTPLLDSTANMINQESIAKMKDGVFIINTARGGLVNYKELYDALKCGKVQGAGLDVLENEPLEKIDRDLISLPNTVVTPHSAFISNESEYLLWEICAKSVGAVLRGDKPDNIKNLEIIDALNWLK